MPEESDCIITGPREINFYADTSQVQSPSPKINDNVMTTMQINIPIDNEKSVDAEERVKRYRI
jgi:hypothetical protein